MIAKLEMDHNHIAGAQPGRGIHRLPAPSGGLALQGVSFKKNTFPQQWHYCDN